MAEIQFYKIEFPRFKDSNTPHKALIMIYVLSDYLISLHDWFRNIMIRLYMLYLYYLTPRNNIIYAIALSARAAPSIERYKYRDVLASVICFYYFSRVLAPSRLQMWLKRWNKLDATDVELVYVNDGRIIHRCFNLNNDTEHITLLTHPESQEMVEIRENDISLCNYDVV